MQILYEFERSVLSKDQLAAKTGKDAGSDVLLSSAGEQGPSSDGDLPLDAFSPSRPLFPSPRTHDYILCCPVALPEFIESWRKSIAPASEQREFSPWVGRMSNIEYGSK